MNDIAIYGAGGLGRETFCLLRIINKQKATWNFIGFFDDGIEKGSQLDYGMILGGANELNNWNENIAVVFAISKPLTVKKLVGSIDNTNIYFPNIISPDLVVFDEKSLNIGKGNIIQNNCIISCNINIGDFNILNGCIKIGHDTNIGSFNAFMTSATISGEVEIGNFNFLGASAVILQQVKIGNTVRVGAGSVVIRNTKNDTLYVGNPAIRMRF